MDVKTIAVAILGGAFDSNELGDNDIACVPGALEDLQLRHVTGCDDVQLELVERSHVDRLTAERDALQQLLNARDEEIDSLRAQLVERNSLLGFVDDQLTNMQPHIEQSCYPGRVQFIDNYVDPILERVRALSAGAEPSAGVESKQTIMVSRSYVERVLKQTWYYDLELNNDSYRYLKGVNFGAPVGRLGWNEPSAPFEIDERAAFEAEFKKKGRPLTRADYDPEAYGNAFDDGAWLGWQARSALEHKP